MNDLNVNQTPASQPNWNRVDAYFGQTLLRPDSALTAAAQRSDIAGLPPIAVSPTHAVLLQLLVQMMGAKRVLEVGTLGGYSTIALARGVGPGGSVLSLEIDPFHAQVARHNLTAAGVADIATVQVGKAADSLQALVDAQCPAFDFIFIDADKPSNPIYLDFALQLAKSGTVIVVDNVVRDGQVSNPKSREPAILGTRQLCEKIGANAQLTATSIQTVGLKGYDGFLIARVS